MKLAFPFPFASILLLLYEDEKDEKISTPGTRLHEQRDAEG
jgi:hypothetical protein